MPIGGLEYLKSPEFNELSFILDHKHNSLAHLIQALRAEKHTVQQETTQLINEEYIQFINLAQSLLGLDDSISNQTRNLTQVRTEISNLKLSLEEKQEALKRLLLEKKQEKQKSEFLMLSIDLVERFQRLSNQLESITAPDGSETLGLRLHTISLNFHDQDQLPPLVLDFNTLERLQLEYTQIEYLIDKIKSNDLLDMKSVIRTMESDLVSLLKEIKGFIFGFLMLEIPNYVKSPKLKSLPLEELKSADCNLQDLVRICSRLNCVDLISKTFHHLYVRDLKLKLQDMNPAEFLNEFKEFVEWHLPLFTLCNDAIRSNILLESVHKAIMEQFVEQHDRIFAVDDLNVFVSNYKLVKKFEEYLEQLKDVGCKNLLENRWGVGVYWQLRYMEIVSVVEESYSSALEELNGVIAPKERTEPLSGEAVDGVVELPNVPLLFKIILRKSISNLKQCLLKIWDESVHIPRLAPKSFKTTLNLIKRFTFWCFEVETYDRFILLYELLDLRTWLNEYYPKVEFCLPKSVHSQAKSCFDVVISDIPTSKIYSKIIDERFDLAKNALEFINTIPVLYRRTGRPSPTTHSEYIDTLFKQSEGDDILTKIDPKWKINFCELVMKEYTSLTVKMITNMIKIEESLKRFKKARGSGESDEDKVRKQCIIDMKQMKVMVEQYCGTEVGFHELVAFFEE